MKTLLLLVFLGLADDDRMVSGSECSKGAVTWIAYLNNDNDCCSGALIHTRWVLAAAHCYYQDIQVRLGQHKWGQFIAAELVIIHPKYNRYTRDNDIMLIKLSQPAAMNQNVVPVPLPKQCALADEMCRIDADLPASVSFQLQCLDALVVDYGECKRSHPGFITDNMMCVRSAEKGPNHCKVDSGGPMVCNGVLQGVGLWVYGSKVTYPDVYTRVCNYVSWIHYVIAVN